MEPSSFRPHVHYYENKQKSRTPIPRWRLASGARRSIISSLNAKIPAGRDEKHLARRSCQTQDAVCSTGHRLCQLCQMGSLPPAELVGDLLRLSQLDATFGAYYDAAAVLIIFGDSFCFQFWRPKCAVGTGDELTSKSPQDECSVS